MFPGPESSSVPAFVAKLWQMVCDPNYDDVIAWCEHGTSFLIKDQSKFSEVLPMYFKHNNIASFIRQLNKYGFRKVLSVNSASLKGDESDFEFCHPFFLRDSPLLLQQIKRKVSISRELSEYKNDQGLLTKLLLEVQEMKAKQSAFESRISSMKAENDALWREHSILRQKHQKQQKIVNRLIHFLLSLVHQSRQGVNVKRRSLPLMIKDGSCLPLENLGSLKEQRLGTTPVICELDPSDYALNSAQSKVAPTSQNIDVIIPESIENISTMNPESPASNNIGNISSPSKIANPVQGIMPTIVLEPTILQTNPNNSPIKTVSNQNVGKLPEKRSLVLSNDKRVAKVRKIAPNIQNNDLSELSASSSNTDSKSLSPNLRKVDKKSYSSMISSGKASSKPDSKVTKTKTLKNYKDIKYVPIKNIEVLKNEKGNENLLNKNTTVDDTDINFIDPYIFSNNIDYTTEDQSSLLSSDPIIFSPEGTQILSPEHVELPAKDENLNTSLVLSDSSNSAISKQDVESHIDLMQSDLDALKEMLHGEGLSLDASTIMGLFGSDDPLTLNMPEAGRSTDNLSPPIGNELVTYSTPSLIDITDGLDEDELAVNGPLLDEISSTLNTPAATLTLDLPSPSPSKRLKK